MANQWLRLWHEMPNDPKWRTIAIKSGQPISLVLAIYIHLLVDASRNVTRGHIDVTAEDLASALDVTEEQIQSVLDAMEGRVINDKFLSGWDARQPLKEDAGNPETGAKSASQRKREQRERDKLKSEQLNSHEMSRNVTTDKDKDKDTENISIPNGIDCPQPSAEDKSDPCPHQEIIALYAKHLPMGIQPRTWTGSRAVALKARWREDKKRQSLAWWERFFAYIATSPFLTGKVYDTNRKPFEITLEWIVTPKNFAKIIDGNYHSKEASNA